MLHVLRVVATALFTIVVGSAGYAFAAQNTGLAGPGGDGTGPISGYSVSNISYTLKQSDPTLIEAVRFDLDGDASAENVMVRLSEAGNWHPCAVSSDGFPARATCSLTSPVPVSDVTELRVIAVD